MVADKPGGYREEVDDRPAHEKPLHVPLHEESTEAGSDREPHVGPDHAPPAEPLVEALCSDAVFFSQGIEGMTDRPLAAFRHIHNPLCRVGHPAHKVYADDIKKRQKEESHTQPDSPPILLGKHTRVPPSVRKVRH